MTASESQDRFGARVARTGGGLVWTLVVVAVVALAIGAYLVLGRSGSSGLRTTAETAEVTRQDFDITTTASGELEARNRVELRSRLERQSLITFIVEEGKRVKQGDLLVQLQTDQIKSELDEEEARVVSARAQVESARNAYIIQENENTSKERQAQLAIALTELSLSQWLEGEVVIKRRESQLDIERAELELERLADRFARSQELYDQKFLSKDEMDRDEVSYIEAISKWKTSRLESNVFETYQFPKDEKQKKSDVTEALAELERVRLNSQSELASKLADRTNAEQTLALRQTRFDRLKQQFESATIKAPQDGLVVYATSLERGGWGGRGENMTLQIGQQVAPNQLIIILPDTSEMIATVRVPEALAGRIRPNMPADVRIDAAGRTFTGKVESIGVIAETGGWRDPNLREYTVRIALDIGDNADKLKPSMRAEAKVTLGQSTDALSVPIQAVFQDGPVRFVYRVGSDGTVLRVPVKLGKRSDARAELLAGVSAGDRVLVREVLPGELTEAAWKTSELTLAGYAVDEKGQPKTEGLGEPRATPNGPGSRGPRANGQERPQGSGDAAEGPRPRDGANPNGRRKSRDNDAAKPASPPDAAPGATAPGTK